jgi:hypothetical protein
VFPIGKEMSTELEKLERRLKAVETALEEIKKLGGVPGPRGPSGDITAAICNAERIAYDGVADAKKSIEPDVQAMKAALKETQQANSDGLAAADEKTRIAVAKFQKLFDERFKNLEHEAASYILPLLHEYGLLKDGSPNADYFRSEFEPAAHKKFEKKVEPREQ